ncbi:hypothetical protein DRN63_00270 [Nanoarchaeota archaeon]|nr:MAG: hypothetical protein DRN63_00270 [Nanoarchaeota archaeon]
MRNKITIIIAMIFLTLLLAPVRGQSCGLGTMQPVKGFIVVPGGVVEGKIYFYNLYDSLTTHVLVTLDEAPEGWGIEIEPPAQNVVYQTPLGEVTVFENINVPKMSKTSDCKNAPEGFTLIKDTITPGVCIPAREVVVRIRVPENVQIGKTYEVKVKATGNCLSPQAGTVATSQVREFTFQIKPVLSGEFYEIRKEAGFNLWNFLAQNALTFSILLGIVCALIVILILRKMGKLVIEVKIK